MKRATLDTSVLLEYWKQQEKESVVEILLQRAQGGALELAISARVREDVPRPPLAGRINELPLLSVREVGAVIRPDHWVLDRDDLGSTGFVEVSKAPPQSSRPKGGQPPDWRDWDHLHAHYLSGRDAFLTWDTGMLAQATVLRERLGISVLSPEDFLAQLDGGAIPQQR